MRIAIIGTGGVGAYLGSKLWKAGHDIHFIARGEHLAEMQKNGLRLESIEGNLHVRADFQDTLPAYPNIDIGIISVKSYDTPNAVHILKPALKNDSIVLTVQNGIDNIEIIGDLIGSKSVMGAAAYIISTISAPGIVRHEGGTGKFKFGESDGKISQRGLLVKKIFSEAGINSELVPNIEKALWEKWIFICGISGMATYARKTIGEILSDQSLKKMLRELISEIIELGRAKGVDQFEMFEDKVISRYMRLPPGTTSSMYYDLMHGKRLEIESLNGKAVRLGRELNIETPGNKIIYDALKQFS